MSSQTLINQQWVFGQRAGFDFSTSPPTPTAGFAMSTFEGCASISDANGNLLFYTDGNIVWDSTHTPRVSGLFGNGSSTQSAIIVPDPGNSQQFYACTADGVTGGNNHFNGRRLDISTWTSVPLSSLMTMPTTAGLSPTEKVTAIQHANCVDFWVLTVLQANTPLDGGRGPGILRVFLITASGMQHVGDTPLGANVHDVGYLRASPDGSRLALANWQNLTVLLYDFDTAVGTVNLSSLITFPAPSLVPPVINHPRTPYGVEFSPDSKVLYYSVLGVSSGTGPVNNGYIFQVDLTATTPVPLQIVTYTNPAPGVGYSIGALQLGPDGKIYVAKHGEQSVGAIQNPNVLGAGCNPNMNFITLQAGTLCNLGLPNMLPNLCECSCADEGCDEEVAEANQILDDRAEKKQFTIVANGQAVPTTCNLAFENAAFAPVFTLEWGDGPSDQLETDDLEFIYIRIYNPFRNLVYRTVKIFNIKITPNQTLPDGEDTLRIIPAEIACFDEIRPCSHVSRDFVLKIDNALVGPYQISFDYCIEEIAIVSSKEGSAVFDINVVAS